MRRSQEVSQYSLERRRRSGLSQEQPTVRLPQEPSDEDQIWQNSTACVDGHRAAVQEKDTAHVKHSAHGAKRDTKLKYRTVVLEVLSRLPRCDRASHSGVEDLPQLAMAELSRPDKEEAYRYFQPSTQKVKQRAKEMWCWRSHREQTATHSGVEVLSGPCRVRVSKTERQSSGSVQHVVVNYPIVEYESVYREPTITQ